MGKKLTGQEKENREVQRIIKKIKTLERSYPQNLIERACFRYKDANVRKRKAKEKIEELQEELNKAKQDLK